ncbi:MAG: RNA-binding domain-containing protein [Candidatus Rhabdochlamydia sp.]|jgi:predicted HTH transcriptional regulator
MKYPGQEFSKLEFKSIISANSKITKTIIGFYNAKEGKLIILIKNSRIIEGTSEDIPLIKL